MGFILIPASEEMRLLATTVYMYMYMYAYYVAYCIETFHYFYGYMHYYEWLYSLWQHCEIASPLH